MCLFKFYLRKNSIYIFHEIENFINKHGILKKQSNKAINPCLVVKYIFAKYFNTGVVI